MDKNKIILILTIIAIIFSINYLQKDKITIDTQNTETLGPELVGLTGYLNGAEEGIKISDYRGKVILIDFWTYTCINCIRTLPYITAWDQKYKDKGLVIIGVHTPEFEFEKDPENVKMAIKDNNIEYLVVQDNDYRTWTSFKNRFWPRKYLIDKEGVIRYDHIGEGGYQETESKIQELLLETGADLEDMGISDVKDAIGFGLNTPELYAGYEFALPRGQNIGNQDGLKPATITEYTLPEKLEPDIIYLKGEWESNPDDLTAKDDASIVLNFIATSVNIVADTATPQNVEILINNKPALQQHGGKDTKFENDQAIVTIDEPKLYNIYSGAYGRNVIEIKVKKDFKFNAFTFG